MAPKQSPRDIMRDFIRIYRSFPCLWQLKNKDYNDRSKKSKAYAVLAEKFKQLEPSADKTTVAKKINAMRTVYRKEMLKVKRSLEEGATGDDVYKPRLWYFDLLRFLNDQDLSWTLGATDDKGKEEEQMTQFIDPFDGQASEAADAMPDESELYTLTPAEPQLELEQLARQSRSGSNPRRRITVNTAELLVTGTENQAREVEKNKLEEDDECDLFGKMIAKKLKKLPEYERELVMYDVHGIFVNRMQLNYDDDAQQ